jgi:molybdate transport system regulatory protein
MSETPRLFVRCIWDGVKLGPGKIALLEAIEKTGSISAAARSMDMSYRRAWLLVADINHAFRKPAVAAQTGGKAGGNATLTPFGQELVREYRAIERDAFAAAAPHLARLGAELAEPGAL